MVTSKKTKEKKKKKQASSRAQVRALHHPWTMTKHQHGAPSRRYSLVYSVHQPVAEQCASLHSEPAVDSEVRGRLRWVGMFSGLPIDGDPYVSG